MKVKKGFAVSVVFAVITVISLLMFMIRSGNGNDGPGLILIMCALAAAASLIAGAIITLIKRKGRQP